jgi:hypothetical protein
VSPRDQALYLETYVRKYGGVRKAAEVLKLSHTYVGQRCRVFADDVLAGPVMANRLDVSSAQELLRVADQCPLPVREGLQHGGFHRALNFRSRVTLGRCGKQLEVEVSRVSPTLAQMDGEDRGGDTNDSKGFPSGGEEQRLEWLPFSSAGWSQT